MPVMLRGSESNARFIPAALEPPLPQGLGRLDARLTETPASARRRRMQASPAAPAASPARHRFHPADEQRYAPVRADDRGRRLRTFRHPAPERRSPDAVR